MALGFEGWKQRTGFKWSRLFFGLLTLRGVLTGFIVGFCIAIPTGMTFGEGALPIGFAIGFFATWLFFLLDFAVTPLGFSSQKPEAPAASPRVPATPKKRCPTCQEQVEADSLRCQYCGSRFF